MASQVADADGDHVAVAGTIKMFWVQAAGAAAKQELPVARTSAQQTVAQALRILIKLTAFWHCVQQEELQKRGRTGYKGK